MKILLLEDDKNLNLTVKEELEDNNYDVISAFNSDKAIDFSYSQKFDLYLFDVNVPGISGFELLKELRQSGDTTPTIFLTSKNEIDDIKKGFEVGANDYVKKPFDFDELLIRIEAKLPKITDEIISSKLAINPNNYTIIVNNNEIILAKKEFEILHLLIRNKDNVIETFDIIDQLYQDETISIATFRVYIKKLKKYIDGVGIIENIRGVGYRFKAL